MITDVTVVVAEDGDVCLFLPRTDMKTTEETVISVTKGRLRIGQARRCFVDAVIADASYVEAMRRCGDIVVLEADEDGFRVHEKVRKLE